MIFLIAGGTGLIGSHLSKQLIQNGHDVYCLSRQIRKENSGVIHYLHYDDLLTHSFTCDALINLAGEPISQFWSSKVKRRILTSRLETTDFLRRAIENQQVKTSVWISGSAIGYYGDQSDLAITENTGCGSGFLADTCVQWEAASQNEIVRTVQLRTGIVLAQNGGILPLWLKSSRYGLGAYFGKGNQYIPWIHIEDICRLILFIVTQTDMSGPVNACSLNPVTQRTLQKELASVLNVPQWLRVPIPLAKPFLRDMSELLFYSQKALPAKALEADFEFKYPSLRIALENLLLTQSANKK